jgi:hypothetical protein
MRYSSLLVFTLLLACQSDEADKPELLTKPAQQIGPTSAVLEAEVTETGPIKPITIGFLWSTTNNLTLAEAPGKYIIGDTGNKGPFSIKVETLAPATIYYYRAYASDVDVTKVWYGAIVEFTTLP